MSQDTGTQSGSGSRGTLSGECEGEDEEPSSSIIVRSITDDLEKTSCKRLLEPMNENAEKELSDFREQWQKELGSPNKFVPNKQESKCSSKDSLGAKKSVVESDEEKAKNLFLKGAEYERNGELYDAIKFYKRAVQLIPDIELRIYESTKLKNKSKVEETSNKINVESSKKNVENNKFEYETGDHLENIKKIVLKNGYICVPEFDQKSIHISSLPNELIFYILRWVISGDLDMVSLEKFASVCRGFYICARDPEIWRLACVRTWGINCCTFKSLGYTSWRDMFIKRPRLRFNGCYISTTTYVRPGENSFQDQFYRPWHLVKYFRYLRFFPDGVVLTLTTPDEPILCLDRLKHRYSRAQGVIKGHYRLNGDKVDIFIGQPVNPKLKAKRIENSIENTFHLELQIKSHHSRMFFSLVWLSYNLYSLNLANGNMVATGFEIVKSKFPSFKFSQVNRYHAKSEDQLE